MGFMVCGEEQYIQILLFFSVQSCVIMLKGDINKTFVRSNPSATFVEGFKIWNVDIGVERFDQVAYCQ